MPQLQDVPQPDRTSSKNEPADHVEFDAKVVFSQGSLCLDLHRKKPQVVFDVQTDCYLWDPDQVFVGNGDILLHNKTKVFINVGAGDGLHKIQFNKYPGGGRPQDVPIVLSD